MIDGWENIARWDDISRQMLKNYRPNLDNLKKGEIAPLLTKEEEKQYHKERDKRWREAVKKANKIFSHYTYLWD